MHEYMKLRKYIEEAGLENYFEDCRILDQIPKLSEQVDSEKELDDLIDSMDKDSYFELEDLYFSNLDESSRENYITILWWKADHIVKDMRKLVKAGRIEQSK